jgi:hypothetical protein
MNVIAAQPIPIADAKLIAWVSLRDAAVAMRCSEGHLRRLCSDQYGPAKLARKSIDGSWEVARSVVIAKARQLNTEAGRDRAQLGELHREGYSSTAIAIAERKRGIVFALRDFTGHARTDDARLAEFCNHLKSTGALPAKGIKKLKPRTLWQWRSDYEARGLRGLIRSKYPTRGECPFGDKAREEFLRIMGSSTGIDVFQARDLVQGYVIQVGLGDDVDWVVPSPRTAQNWWKQNVPKGAKLLIRKGIHKFRAKGLPKIRRSYEGIAAGDVLCGDERTLDLMCRVPGDRGWRRIRPKLTAFMDVRSRKIVGWFIGEWANSDTILSTFKAGCLAMGMVCVTVIIDNGRDYKAVGGPARRNRRKWDEFNSSRVQTAFERLDITTQYALPRHPWSKMIESHFRTVKNRFDRLMVGFWGGSPDDRPADAEQWTKTNLLELPTLEQVREDFAALLESHHEAPQRGNAMNGLCPNQAFRQYVTTSPRQITEEALALICSTVKGPVKVSQDGVRYQGQHYGKWQDEVWRLQGREVFIAVDPVAADRVTICEQDGTPICVAMADKNIGQTREEVRDGQRHSARCTRVAKQYVHARDYLTKTPMQQIAARRKLAAQARQIPDSQLPAAAQTESIRLVRPDIAAATEKMQGAARKAAGAEALRRLNNANTAAESVNEFRRIDISQTPTPMDDESRPQFKRLDLAKMNGSEP